MADPISPDPGGVLPDPSISKLRDVLRQGAARARKNFPPEIQRKADEAGAIGRFIGDKEHHAANIATIAIVGLLVITGVTIIGLMILSGRRSTLPEAEEGIKTIVLSLVALMGTILGYLFGRNSK